jgi:hypothetical protein
MFERCPVWLWTLCPAEWHTIWMSTADKTRLRDHYVSTLEQFEGKILAFDESRRPDEPQAAITDLWWISGSEGFCSAPRISSHGAIRVVWRSSGGRRTPQSGSGEWNWYSIAHANVGGVTNARGIFGVSGLDQIIFVTTNDAYLTITPLKITQLQI